MKKFLVPVIGVISSGKSSFLNALLGTEIFQIDSDITTQFFCIIRHNESLSNPILYKIKEPENLNAPGLVGQVAEYEKDTKNEEDEDKPIIKYYVLDNNTDYKETIYYTMSKFNNKIVINSDNEYGTMAFDVKENKDKEIYDITIDPGHGGMDSGGTAGGHNESYYTMIVSNKIKENLEAVGFKVKLTHEEGELTRNDLLDNYNEHGRAVIPNEVKSKYTFSIHFNKNTSSKVSGFEIYTPANINYDFAKILADSIIEYTDLGYSTNKLYKYYNGIYSRNFNDNDIASSLTEYENKGYAPYNVTTNSNYYFMIRETGGFMTGAYVDNSNLDKVGVNPYYNSNVGNETYLLELGYLSNPSNLDIISSDYDAIAKAVSEAIIAKFSE